MESLSILSRFFYDNFSWTDWDTDSEYQLSPPSAPQSPIFPPSSSTSQTVNGIRILTHNTWGLPITPLSHERLTQFSSFYDSWDIIVFQEVTHRREVKCLVESAAEHGLIYYHQFSQGIGFPLWRGICGPGLLVVSRYPIIDANYRRYSVNGKIHRFDHCDYLGAKGVGLVRIDVTQHPNNNNNDTSKSSSSYYGIDIFTTHLHANYSNYYSNYNLSYQTITHLPTQSYDEYLAHRVAQAYELARFVIANRRNDHLCVVAGDINAPPYDICLHMIQRLANLHDSYALTYPFNAGYTIAAEDNTFSPNYKQHDQLLDDNNVSSSSSSSSTLFTTMKNSVTSTISALESELINLHTKKSTPSKHDYAETPKRIDYVLFSLPTHRTTNFTPAQPLLPFLPPTTSVMPLLSHEVPFRLIDSQVVKKYVRINNKQYSISDHFGVGATFHVGDADSDDEDDKNYNQSNPSSNVNDNNNSNNSSSGNGNVPGSASSSPVTPPRRRFSNVTAIPTPGTARLSLSPVTHVHVPTHPLSSSDPPLTPKIKSSDKSTSSSLSHVEPSILQILQVAAVLVNNGIKDVANHRKQHFQRCFTALFLYLFLEYSGINDGVQYLINADILLVSLALYIVQWIVSFVPIYSLFEWLLAQFPVKEEQAALQQIYSELITATTYLKSQNNPHNTHT